MYAVAFDLIVADTEQHHPKGGHKPILKLVRYWLSMDFTECKEKPASKGQRNLDALATINNPTKETHLHGR